jgi:methionine synthase reductase
VFYLYFCLVCSTTGNGDTPDNADKFWRTIKKRALAKDTFEGMPYTVLGLGDTNYDKFCFMGKSLDKRINELGGKRFFDLHCADEATGLEEVVEEWNDAVVGALQELLEMGGCNSPKE